MEGAVTVERGVRASARSHEDFGGIVGRRAACAARGRVAWVYEQACEEEVGELKGEANEAGLAGCALRRGQRRNSCQLGRGRENGGATQLTVAASTLSVLLLLLSVAAASVVRLFALLGC